MSEGRWGECYPDCSSRGSANNITPRLSQLSNSTCPAFAGSIISKDQQSLLVSWQCKSTQNQHRTVLWWGFFFIPLSLPPSSSSLILILRVLYHSLTLLLAMGTTERKDRWWERWPQPCKGLASLLLGQGMSGRHLAHYSCPFLFSDGRMGLTGWVLTSANVSLSSHVSFSNSSMGICKARLPLYAFLHASKDIHLLHWWSDDYSSKEGDESDNLDIKSENSSYSTVMEHKN